MYFELTLHILVCDNMDKYNAVESNHIEIQWSRKVQGVNVSAAKCFSSLHLSIFFSIVFYSFSCISITVKMKINQQTIKNFVFCKRMQIFIFFFAQRSFNSALSSQAKHFRPAVPYNCHFSCAHLQSSVFVYAVLFAVSLSFKHLVPSHSVTWLIHKLEHNLLLRSSKNLWYK